MKVEKNVFLFRLLVIKVRKAYLSSIVTNETKKQYCF